MLMDSAVIHTRAQRVEYWSCLMHTLPNEVGQGDILPFCFRSPTVNTDPFRGLFNAIFPPISVLPVGDFAVYNGPQR